MSPRGHRVALLIDGTTVGKSTRDLIDWLDRQPDITLAALIVHAPPIIPSRWARLLSLKRRIGLHRAASQIAFSLLRRYERAVFMRSPVWRAHTLGYDVADVAPVMVVAPQVSKSGNVYRFGAADLARVHALDLDLLVRQGSGILRGGILTAARHGVLSFHHGDNRVNRGGPAAFWEAYAGSDETGFIVQRLTDELDGGQVIARGAFSTDPVYSRNEAMLYERSNIYLTKAIARVLAGTAAVEPSLPYAGPLHRMPLLHQTAGYLLRTALRMLARLRLRVFRKRYHWQIGYQWSDWPDLVMWRANRLPNPPGSFLADPFVLCHGGDRYLFVEEYLYAKEKGVVSAYRMAPGGIDRLGIVLEEDCHLSYPYVFEHGGQVYMLPETQDLQQVRLYRADNFPTGWRLEKVLLDDVVAADATMFEVGGRWWMFATIRPTPLGANDSELHLFEADGPLGEWTPHPGNPLCIDPSRGRMGGMVRDGNAIYRIGQRQRFGRYGAGFGIFRIDVLDSRCYRETEVQKVTADFAPGLLGTHHLHSAGGLTAFDFVREMRPRRDRGGKRA